MSLTMMGTRLSEPGVAREVAWRAGGSPVSVLPAAAIFGGNASGKTNVLRVMSDLRDYVLRSFRSGDPSGPIPTRPFYLDADSINAPSRYELALILNGVLHEYQVELTHERVVREHLAIYPNGRETLVFDRFEDAVRHGSQHKSLGRAVTEILRPNALFASTAAAVNHPILLPFYEWFQRNLLFADVQTRTARQAMTANMLESEVVGEQVLELLREADLGITGATKRELDPEMKERVVKALRTLRGEEGSEAPDTEITFDDVEVHLLHQGAGRDIELATADESRGTLIWFGMVGPIIEVLQNGSLLLADELDASLHPALVSVIVSLFQSPQSNPRRAQIIFNSHDTTLMDSGPYPLGRDQVWFTEKAIDGCTTLYPMSDLNPRKGEAKAKRYLEGRYGGAPIVSERAIETIVETVPTALE